MTDTFTPNFRLTRTEFNTRNWQDKMNNNFTVLDSVVGQFLPLSGLKGVWVNSLPILLNDLLIDIDLGTIWKALVPHTTPATGTFAQDRTANPSRWTAYAKAGAARGEWTTATNYNVNDFVVVTSGLDKKYAIALTTHTSGATFAADLALGKWSVLIDVTLTGLGLGTIATQNANNVNISGGVITGIDFTTVPVVAADVLDHVLIAEASNSDILARSTVASLLGTPWIAGSADFNPPVTTDNISIGDAISSGRITLAQLFDLIFSDRFAAGTSDTSLTITAGSGTFTTVSGEVRTRTFGKYVHLSCNIVMTTIGTAASFISVAGFSVPVPFGGVTTTILGLNRNTGLTIRGELNTAGNGLVITNYDASTSISGNGHTLKVEGLYEAA